MKSSCRAIRRERFPGTSSADQMGDLAQLVRDAQASDHATDWKAKRPPLHTFETPTRAERLELIPAGTYPSAQAGRVHLLEGRRRMLRHHTLFDELVQRRQEPVVHAGESTLACGSRRVEEVRRQSSLWCTCMHQEQTPPLTPPAM